MAESMIVLSTSITEAMPINLLEASASGTPFVARNIGAIPSLDGGQCCGDDVSMINEVGILCSSPSRWEFFSKKGLEQYRKEFTEAQSRLNFLEIVKDISHLNGLGDNSLNA
jgi:glycosyltransferase involved in cell wall biosynthesis